MGELLWDCFGELRQPGGAPANVAFHAQQLGHRGTICSRVGDDDLGRELLEYVAARDLETRFIQRDNERPTGRVTVDTTNPERPSYVIHEDVAWDGLEFSDELEQLMRNASAVCFGTLAQRNIQSQKTIHRALWAAEKALIVYDVNLRSSWYWRAWIEWSMRASQIVKLNTEEIGVLEAVLDVGSAEPLAFAGALRDRFGVEITCITRADQGCLVIGPTETVDVPGTEVDVADAVGAGDAFTAALISGCLRGWPLPTTATFANEVGALVASRPGAMPVLRDEYADLVSRMEDGGVPCRRL